ncbi:hypothetical protein LIER_30153 [Lithospermum erythrorhizon]|uniref:Uncharacterized protein n=1 Tax=Lithospermum erythrorhizon TaxID=34254 RepID=A0AAV3RQC6_LITER
MEAQHSDIVAVDDEEALALGFITISPKLMQGTHVPDIPLRAVETGGGSSVGNDETAHFLMDEIKHLEGVIQKSLAKKSVLKARLRSLVGEDDPVIDPATSDNEAAASQE